VAALHGPRPPRPPRHVRKDQHDALGAVIRQLFTPADGEQARRRLGDAVKQLQGVSSEDRRASRGRRKTTSRRSTRSPPSAPTYVVTFLHRHVVRRGLLNLLEDIEHLAERRRRELYLTTRAIVVMAVKDVETFDRVFGEIFGSPGGRSLTTSRSSPSPP
jgi:hypothetical protein